MHQQTTAAITKILHCCAHHLWSEWRTTANNQWDLTAKHVLDSYNKYKKETQVIVGISAIPIGRIRITNQVLAGRVPYALIPLCDWRRKPDARHWDRKNEEFCKEKFCGRLWSSRSASLLANIHIVARKPIYTLVSMHIVTYCIRLSYIEYTSHPSTQSNNHHTYY